MAELSRAEFDVLFNQARKQAQKLLGDFERAEDVAAEAMGRLIMGGKDRKHFKLIVHGLAVDAVRKGRETPWDIGAVPESEEDKLLLQQPLTFEQVEFRADFDRAVRALDEDDRQAFLLTEVRGLTVREAASILDIAKTTVAARAERARVQIKEALA